jgi:hypothetical protein
MDPLPGISQKCKVRDREASAKGFEGGPGSVLREAAFLTQALTCQGCLFFDFCFVLIFFRGRGASGP